MTIYPQFSTDPGLNNKPAPLGAQEGAFPRKQISDTFRTVMAAIAELGELVDSINAASTTEAGLVELATSSEVVAGTDAVRAVTPAGLVTLTATLVRAGLVELATAAETLTGSDTTRALTPAGLSGNTNKSASTGYIRYPGGLLVQFGNSTTISGGTKAINFPVTHGTTVLSLLFTPLSLTQNFACRVVSVTTTSFGMQMFDTATQTAAPSGVPFYWQSIGY